MLAFTVCSATFFAQNQATARPVNLKAKFSADKAENNTTPLVKKTNPLYLQRQLPLKCLNDNEGIVKQKVASPKNTVDVKAFPNPFVSDITVTINDALMSKSNYAAQLYDLQGKKVFSQNLSFNQNTLNITGIAAGMYVLNVQKNGATVLQEKIVKQ